MTKFERLLLPASDERPDCRCGHSMTLLPSDALSKAPSDVEFRTYVCQNCGHELKITIWKNLQ